MAGMDRIQLEQYKAEKMADLSGRLQRKKQSDTDQAWLKAMRARTAESWTKEDEDRALRSQREEKVDKRGDIIYDQGQETYQHGLQRRPVVEQRQDELSGLNIRGARARVAQAGKGQRGTLVTSYDPATDSYKRELIDQYTGKATQVESDYAPVQSKKLYDVTSAEVAAWKASNFDKFGKLDDKDFVPLDEWVLQMREFLGGRAAVTGGLQQGTSPLADPRRRIGQPGGLSFKRGQSTSRTKQPVQKKIAVPGLYAPIP